MRCLRSGRRTLGIVVVTAILLLTGCRGLATLFSDTDVFPDVVSIDAAGQAAVDEIVADYLPNYRYISIALVHESEIIYTATYGRDRRGARDIYASVSKPVTATILLRLYEDGVISSLDYPITDYVPGYADTIPEEYAGSVITLSQLLTHQSGLPGQAPLVRTKPWPLLFAPGTDTSYSTWGYGVLGAVMEDVTGEHFGELVKQYIGAPVNAESFRADDLFFDTHGGRVWSTVPDMARFAIGIADGTYMGEETLRDEVLQAYGSDAGGTIGLGRYVSRIDEPDPGMYHAASNGAPRAFIAVTPFSGAAVCLAGRNRSADGEDDFGALAGELVGVVEGL
jgi:CubicO group peptidase (beta-lactamase class C family)